MEEKSCSCRPGCGACCIAPSISSPIPGMPLGKPAGMRCIKLTDDNRCLLFGHKERPAVCGSLQPSIQMCGSSVFEALAFLTRLERETSPISNEDSVCALDSPDVSQQTAGVSCSTDHLWPSGLNSYCR